MLNSCSHTGAWLELLVCSPRKTPSRSLCSSSVHSSGGPGCSVLGMATTEPLALALATCTPGQDPTRRPAPQAAHVRQAALGKEESQGVRKRQRRAGLAFPNTGGNTAALTLMTLEAFILRSRQTYFQLPCSASPPLSLQTLKYIVPFCLTMAACSSFSLVSISHDSLACK